MGKKEMLKVEQKKWEMLIAIQHLPPSGANPISVIKNY
jgi:hypothetical protein